MRNLFYIVPVLFIVLLASCRGDEQNKLIGTWEYISHSEPDTTKLYWQFYAGDALNLYRVGPNNELIGDTISYTYSIESSSLNIYSVSGSNGDLSGEYWVERLKGDEFKATKQKDANDLNVYERVELIRR